MTNSAAEVEGEQKSASSGTVTAAIWTIASAMLLLHMYFNNRYGYFRDEFDYMACGSHLAWGFVDQPPLVPFLKETCVNWSP